MFCGMIKRIETPSQTKKHKMHDIISIFTCENLLVHQCETILSESENIANLKWESLMFITKGGKFTVYDKPYINLVDVAETFPTLYYLWIWANWFWCVEWW